MSNKVTNPFSPSQLPFPSAVVVTSNYTVTPTDENIFVDCSSGNITVSLLQVSHAPGQTLRVTRLDSSANTLKIQQYSGDALEFAQYILVNQFQSITITNDTSLTWYQVNGVASTPSIWQTANLVSTSNVASLSGTSTPIDGVALTAGEVVLLTSQPTSTQNGLWEVNAGTWTRPSGYAAGSTIQPGVLIWISNGSTANKNSIFYLDSSSAIVVDTTATSWHQFSSGTGTAQSFQTWSSIVTYASNNIVEGSDGNLYRSIAGGNINHDPTQDNGTYWNAYQILSNLTLTCGSTGSGYRFTNSGSGIQAAFDFIATAIWNTNTTTVTIQVAPNLSATETATIVLNHFCGEGLVLQGNSSSPASCSITYTGTGPLFLTETALQNFVGFSINRGGISSSNGANVNINNCTFINCANSIISQNNSIAICTNVKCYNATSYSIYVDNSSNLQFANGFVSGGVNGFLSQNGSEILITSSTITGASGVALTAHYNSQITANTTANVISYNGVGVEILGSAHVQVIGASFVANTTNVTWNGSSGSFNILYGDGSIANNTLAYTASYPSQLQGDVVTGTAVGGVLPATVEGIQGKAVTATTPTSNQFLIFDSHLNAYELAQLSNVTVALVATSNVTLSGSQTIDGVSISSGSVLLTNQTTASQNGIWVVNSSGAWTRPTIYDTGNQIQFGFLVFVNQGSTHAKTWWMLSSADPNYVDTTSTTWASVPLNVSSGITGAVPAANGGTGVSNTGASGKILIGQGSSFAEKPISGDISITSAGAATVNDIQGIPFPTSGMTTSGSQVCYNAATNSFGSNWNSVLAVTTVVATTNQTLSGTPTVDGVGTSGGSYVLCTAQTNAVQNGLWKQNGSGAWTRPVEWYTGSSYPDGLLVYCKSGTAHGKKFHMLVGSCTVDTTSSTWTLDIGGGSSGGSVTVKDYQGNSYSTVTELDLYGDVISPGSGRIEYTPVINSSTPISGAPDGTLRYDSTAAAIYSQITIPVWSSGITYSLGNIVQGSDNNYYRCILANTGNNPTTDSGINWQLWGLSASTTLNCGVSQRFSDTFASSSSPGGAMTPGMISAFTFIGGAVGAASPLIATITIQQANNPTFTASATGSTTTILTTTNIPIGASLLAKSGTAGNIGQTTTVTASSYSGGTYTLTVGALPSATTSGDVFVYAPFYGANTITVNLPIVGPNLTIQGSTSTPVCPTFFPSVSTTTGSLGGTYYIALTYTFTDQSGTTRETQAGPVTSQTASGQNLVIASFSVPAYATGVNVYASNSSGGTLHKQGSMTVSGGTASAYTMSSYNSVGASAPVNNPAPACYPCALMWGANHGIMITCTIAVVNGFYIYGNGNTSYAGINVSGSASSLSTPSRCAAGPYIVCSNWGFGISLGQAAYCDASSTQMDTCAYGYAVSNFSELRASPATSLHCTNGGYNANNFGYFNSGGTSAYASFCATGYLANAGANCRVVSANPASGTAQATYGCTFVSSPAANTSGSGNGYVNTSV